MVLGRRRLVVRFLRRSRFSRIVDIENADTMTTNPAPRRAPRRRPAKAASIPDHLFTHPTFRALGVGERWLILELSTRKGQIADDVVGCSVREAADMLGLHKSQAADILAGLRLKGFIADARDPSKGQHRRGTSAGWRLTWLPFRGEPGTFEYIKLADRAARQADAERVAGQAFFVPGMVGYEPPEVSGHRTVLTLEVSGTPDRSVMLTHVLSPNEINGLRASVRCTGHV
jgi:hypothetical protein